jgi:hypothetical protein
MRFHFVLAIAPLAIACQDSTSQPARTAAAPTYAPVAGPAPYGAPYGAPPPGYPAQAQYPQQPQVAPAPQPQYAPPAQPAYAPPTQYAPAAQAPAAPPIALPPPAQTAPPGPSSSPPTAWQASRPLLGPLVGAAAWQGEVRSVVKELIGTLRPENAQRVATIPLVFDPNPNEVNAFAGCDDSGAPFVVGTEGLLEAIDAIAQTKATDELFGTQTYESYVSVVAPRLVTKDGGSALLPAGVIPPQYWLDARRISRAHEIFDETAAFTFGHELSHHYLGHTGCANGQAGTIGPAFARLGQLGVEVLPGLNQPNEIAADTQGVLNTLDTGLARSTNAYRWTERGGLSLLDFFMRLDRASGANPFLGFLRTHPNPGLRIPIVQGVAGTWRLQHGG